MSLLTTCLIDQDNKPIIIHFFFDEIFKPLNEMLKKIKPGTFFTLSLSNLQKS